jgi:hypothetical protein
VYFADAILLVVLALTSSKSTRTLVAKSGERVPCPEAYASLAALALFSWADPLISLGFKRALNKEDIWDFRLSDYSSAVIHHFRQSILATRKNYPFIARLVINFKKRISVQAVWAVICALLTFAGPYALERILFFVKNKDTIATEWGYIYVFGMFSGMLLATVAQSQMLWHGRRISMQLRSIVVGEVYAKALRRKDRAGQTQKAGSSGSDDEDEEENEMFTYGAINNMISNVSLRVCFYKKPNESNDYVYKMCSNRHTNNTFLGYLRNFERQCIPPGRLYSAFPDHSRHHVLVPHPRLACSCWCRHHGMLHSIQLVSHQQGRKDPGRPDEGDR